MKLPAIKTIVNKNYLGNAADDLDPSQQIVDAVNYLSSFFIFERLDEAQVTVADQDWISKPFVSSLQYRVFRLEIDDTFIEEAKFGSLDDIKEINEKRWYETVDKIRLTYEPAESDLVCKIWFNKQFTIPTAAVDTDVPDEMLELVYLGASYRYMRMYLANVTMNRDTFPLIDPDEARQVMEALSDDYNDVVAKFNRKN